MVGVWVQSLGVRTGVSRGGDDGAAAARSPVARSPSRRCTTINTINTINTCCSGTGIILIVVIGGITVSRKGPWSWSTP